MNFIDRSSEHIAKSIRFHNPNAGSEIALKYALSLLINTSTAMTASILFCSLFGHATQCVIGIISYILIRSLTGGMHASSSLSCCILSFVIFTSVAFVTFDYNYYSVVFDLVSIVIFCFTAPNDIQNISKIDPKFYPLLKVLAIALITCNFFIHSTTLTAAFFIQALLTTKIAYNLRNILERRC